MYDRNNCIKQERMIQLIIKILKEIYKNEKIRFK